MGQSDLDSLLKVTRFAAMKGSKIAHQPVQAVQTYIEERVIHSTQAREGVIRKVAKGMKA